MPRVPENRRPLKPEEAFRHVLRDLRRERGLTQDALAFDAGLHRTEIGLLERGQRVPSLRTLYKLAAPLGMEPSAMLARAEELMRRPRATGSSNRRRLG